jgi:ribonuclease D
MSDKYGNCHFVKFDGVNYNAPNLKKLMENENIQKIFHFARLDMAFLYKYVNAMPKNVFCTKIASKLCRTNTDLHSLKDITLEILHVELEKEQQCSDWSAAELSEEQLKYAANDVLYLHQLRDHFIKELEKVHRTELAYSCFEFLSTRVKLDLEGFEDVNILNHH